jgi:GGDEF domain-containing protein
MANPQPPAGLSGTPWRDSGNATPTGTVCAARPASLTAAATLPAHAVDADDLVDNGDRALDKARHRGRDRVEVCVRG